MNTFSKLALLAAAAVFAASASAQTVYDSSVDVPIARTVPASQQANNSNWINGAGDQAWMTNGSTRCVRSAEWASVTANKGCDGAIVEKSVAVIPPPVDTAPIAPPITSEKVTYQAEVRFDFDRTKVKATEQVKLDEIYAKVKGIDNLEVVVVTGYTDEMGSAEYNITLSRHRADAVKQYLVSKGVDSTHIYTEGKGKSNPVVTDCQEQVVQQPKHTVKKQVRSNMIGCLAPNRRVEIQVVGTVHDAQPQEAANDAQPDVGVMQ